MHKYGLQIQNDTCFVCIINYIIIITYAQLPQRSTMPGEKENYLVSDNVRKSFRVYF